MTAKEIRALDLRIRERMLRERQLSQREVAEALRDPPIEEMRLNRKGIEWELVSELQPALYPFEED